MKLAIITSRFPYPLEKGDKLRIYHQIRLLSRNHEVILISLTERKITESDRKELEKFCSAIHVLHLRKWKILFNLFFSLFNKMPLQVAYFYDKFLVKRAKKIILDTKPDHVFAQLIRTVPYVESATCSKTLDYMDAFSAITLRWAEKVPWPMSLFWKSQAKKINRYDRTVYKDFDHHFIISEPDREIMNLESHQTLEVVRNGVDFDYFSPDENKKTYDIAFIGNMGYLPNVEAAKFLVKQILPGVLKTRPGINVLIAGARPSREVKNLEGKHVTVTGWVKDIRDAYNSARIFVAPLFLGAGMQNKILEAMCMRLPCVTTNRVNNAIQAPDKEVLMVANNAKEFEKAILDLLESEEQRKSLSDNAYNFALKNFSWEATVNQIEFIALDHGKKIQHNS